MKSFGEFLSWVASFLPGAVDNAHLEPISFRGGELLKLENGVEVVIPPSRELEYYDGIPNLGPDHDQLVARAVVLFPENSMHPDQYYNRHAWLMKIHEMRTSHDRGWDLDGRVKRGEAQAA